MKHVRTALAAALLAIVIAAGAAGCQNCPPNRHSTNSGLTCSPNN